MRKSRAKLCEGVYSGAGVTGIQRRLNPTRAICKTGDGYGSDGVRLGSGDRHTSVQW